MQSTRIGLLALCFLLSACASVPLPFKGDAKQGAETPAESTSSVPQDSEAGDIDLVAPTVPTPTLHTGSQALFDRGVELMKDKNLIAAHVFFHEIAESHP